MKLTINYLLVPVIGLLALTRDSAAKDGPQMPDRPVVYRLDGGSSFTEGCFPPCLCPVWMTGDVRGTFMLTETGSMGNVTYYDVTDVNWYVSLHSSELRITGSGTYTRILDFAGWAHQLELDLTVDSRPLEHFDSGLVNGGGEFPDITGLTVSINGQYCYDTAIEVHASPVPISEILRYGLGRRSTYQEGCLPPCLCPMLAELPLRGAFALVELANYGQLVEYAVVNVNWRVVSSYPNPMPSNSFVGSGRYTRISGFAGWIHQLELDLSIEGWPPTHFDSGLINGSEEFPRFDIAVAMNGFYCYDIVLNLQVLPRRRVPAP